MSEYDDAYAEPSRPEAPHTLAERYVIGALLKDAHMLRQVQEEVMPRDFSDARLGDIYAGIIRMSAEGAPVDVVTVWDKLADWDVRGIGITDLDGWAGSVTTSQAAVYHAGIVREAALQRSLAAIGTQLQHAEDPGIALAKALEDLKTVRDRDAVNAGGVRWLRDILDVPVEADAYEWTIPDILERKDRLMLSAGEGVGKALALDTLLPTPTGWTTMRDVQVGDRVLGADGIPTRVVAATDVMRDRECYRVEFSDGSSIVADAEHQWMTDSYASRVAASRRRTRALLPHGSDQSWKAAKPAIRTTREIADTLHARDGFCLNHSITVAAPLDLPEATLPIDPWVFGAWLGDGHSAGGRITIGNEDAEQMLTLLAEGGWPANRQSGQYLYGIKRLVVALRELGVIREKHIPDVYLRASYSQRLALLQGLMDTDGTVNANGASRGRGAGASRCEFSVTNERLAQDVHELILSLGIIASLRESDATLNGRVIGRRWRIGFQTDLPVFRLTRKLERITPLRTPRSRRRFVTAVVPVETVPVRCIQVDNEDQMYLAGRTMIPTHNSTLLRQISILSAGGIHPFRFTPMDPINVLVIDAENSERQWRRAARGMADEVTSRGLRDPRGHMAVHCTPVMDIGNAKDLGSLHRWIDEANPDLLVLGPLYRMTRGSLNDEDDAAQVIAALDSLRERDVAMLIEVHAGHARGSNGERELRPRGSSALLGWPEFGLGLRRDKELAPGARAHYSLVKWRGDRDRRAWPSKLARGQVWPWEPTVQV